jgi:hypothetical protein
MSAHKPESIRVHAATVTGSDGTMYDQVFEFDDPESKARTPLLDRGGPRTEGPLRPLDLDFTPEQSKRLLFALRELTTEVDFNCHKFSRIMAGVPVLPGASHRVVAAYHQEQPIDYKPLVPDLLEAERIAPTALAMGQIGLIGTTQMLLKEPIAHAVVGLGEGQEQSLSIKDHHGDLIIANTAELVAIHQGMMPDYPVDLYTQRD